MGILWAGVAATTELTPAQRELVDRGEIATVRQDRPGSSWPSMTVFTFIDATPEDAAAVFTDYEHQASYIPSLKKSHVSRVIDSATAEVDIVLDVPVFSDEEYTVGDHISLDGAGVYRVDWALVRASSTKGTVGHRSEERRVGKECRL